MRILLIFLSLFLTNAISKELIALPLYELGIVYGMGVSPDYPGSDQSRFRYLAVPTFFYRGSTFRRDRDQGTRAQFFKNKELSFDLSFSGSFPANSEDNRAREGMDDLDWLFEIGPRLLWSKIYKNYILRIGIPIRSVISTDFKITKAVGLNFNPSIRLRVDQCFNKEMFQCFSGIDATFVTGEVSDYFYQVKGDDITPTRPAYNARSGYLGSDIFSGLAIRFDRTFSMFTGVSYSIYSNNSNEDSPLFKAKNAASVFMGFSWFFYQSGDNEVIE